MNKSSSAEEIEAPLKPQSHLAFSYVENINPVLIFCHKVKRRRIKIRFLIKKNKCIVEESTLITHKYTVAAPPASPAFSTSVTEVRTSNWRSDSLQIRKTYLWAMQPRTPPNKMRKKRPRMESPLQHMYKEEMCQLRIFRSRGHRQKQMLNLRQV